MPSEFRHPAKAPNLSCRPLPNSNYRLLLVINSLRSPPPNSPRLPPRHPSPARLRLNLTQKYPNPPSSLLVFRELVQITWNLARTLSQMMLRLFVSAPHFDCCSQYLLTFLLASILPHDGNPSQRQIQPHALHL